MSANVEIFGHLSHHRFENLSPHLQTAQPDALQLPEQIMDFNRLVLLPPLHSQFGAQPISQETNPDMVRTRSGRR